MGGSVWFGIARWVGFSSAALFGLPAAMAQAAERGNAYCSPEQVQALQLSDAEGRPATLACSLELAPGDVIRRRLVIEGASASGVVVRCNGARIDPADKQLADKDSLLIRAVHRQGNWSAPSGVRIEGCRIEGSLRIAGMALNGQGEALYAASRLPGYVEQLRRTAPSDVLVTGATITAHGRIPFYIGPGVHGVRLVSSALQGESRSVALYLDAESFGNEIVDNQIAVKTAREQVAIDASARNRIADNRFGKVRHGGIYLYRNCGEGGVIRHTTPSFNTIQNNLLEMEEAGEDRPPIWLGSRQGGRWYCWRDSGYPFGSSADDRDFARDNRVIGNRVQGASAFPLVVIGSPNDTGNVLEDNRLVGPAGR